MLHKRILRASEKEFSTAANNNQLEAFLDMPETQKARLKQRLSDLAWQIKFSDMSRPRWRTLNSNNWTAISDLNDRAKEELRSLLDQEKSRVKNIKKAI